MIDLQEEQNWLISSTNGWEAEHLNGRCGGPRKLTVRGVPVLEKMQFLWDDASDFKMRTEHPRVYHKGGISIFESKGEWVASGHGLRQVSRYAGNAIRTTYDFNCRKGGTLAHSAVLADFTLPGKWIKLQILERSGKAATELPLSADFSRQWSPVPLALVLEREDGFQFQISPGFDLWRWDAGLRMTVPPEEENPETPESGEEPKAALPPVFSPGVFSLTAEGEKLHFQAIIGRPMGDATVPLAGDYRFSLLLAWSDGTAPDFPEGESTELAFGPYGTGCHLPEQIGNHPVLRMDFSRMPNCGSGRCAASGRSCWESNKTIKAAKRCIRQVAGAYEGGTLILTGLSTGLCTTGLHVAKHQETLHWDLPEILGFLNWTRQILGPAWQVLVKGAEPALPAWKSASLPNGFRYHEQEMEE